MTLTAPAALLPRCCVPHRQLWRSGSRKSVAHKALPCPLHSAWQKVPVERHFLRLRASEDAGPELSFVEETAGSPVATSTSSLEDEELPVPQYVVTEAGAVVPLSAPLDHDDVEDSESSSSAEEHGHIAHSAVGTSERKEQPQSSVAVEDRTKAAPSAWELLRFTLPTLGVWIINPILSLVDTSVVGTRSARELAALGPGTQMCDGNAYVFTFLAAATTNMLAISFARKDKDLAGAILSDALAIAAVLGLLLAGGMYAAAPAYLQRLAGKASAAVVEPAVTYVRIRCLGLPAALLIMVTQAFFLAARDPMTCLAAAALAGVANLAGDLWLCCGLDWGIAGASLATAVAQIVTAVSLVAALYRPLRRGSLFPGWKVDVRWRLPSPQAVFTFVGYAGPICGVLFTKVLIYGVLTAAASRIGPVTSASHHVVISIYMFFCMCGDAVSQAAQSFLPGVVGEPKAAQSLGKRLMTTGFVVGVANSLMAGVILVMAPHLFTNSPEVLVTMRSLLPFMCSALLVHTASMATEGMLLAGRDLLFLVWSYIANMLLVFAALWGLQAGPLDFNALGIWWCLLQFQVVRLVMNGIRLLTRRSPLRATEPLQSAGRALA